MDRLSPFLSRFSISARVFFSGQLCGTSSDHATKTAGHLHVLRKGVLNILQPADRPVEIREPTVLLYPRPGEHTFQSDGADILCAAVEFGAGTLNPLVSAIPKLLAVPLASVPELAPTAELLFGEAFERKDGRQVAVDRLAEYFLILLLRSAINSQFIQGGILAALSDPHLSKSLAAIHDKPEMTWTLEKLAQAGGMSRARFAAHFLATTGQTPFEYLAVWRTGVAQSLLKKGEPLKMVAPAVGYTSAGALSRSFFRHVGMTPTAWLTTQRNGEAN
jgi:AraC-like DNA-binding protein